MKSRIVCWVLFCAGIPLQQSFATPLYHLTDLGVLSTETSTIEYSLARGINNAGQVVGESRVPAPGGGGAYFTRAFLWNSSTGMQNLGDLPGGSESTSEARAINAGGTVVGFGGAPTGARAFRWTSATGMQDIGALPALNTQSYASAINTPGTIVGYSNAGSGGFHAFRWTSGGGMQDLGVLEPTGFQPTSQAYGINDGDQIVGNSSTNNGPRAFLWTSAGGMQNLGLLPGGANPQSFAYGINASGNVVGLSSATGGFHAFLWTSAGGMQDLGDLPGGSVDATGFAINSVNQVVGYSRAADTDRAFLWTSLSGMVDLNTLLDSSSSAWFLGAATGINDSGQIVGHAYHPTTGRPHAFLLTLVPEPEGRYLALAGVVGLLALHRLRRTQTAADK